MSRTLYLTDERAIGVDVVYERLNNQYVVVAHTVFDLDIVNDVTKDLWDWEFDTEAEALAVARNYITQLGLEVNQ